MTQSQVDMSDNDELGLKFIPATEVYSIDESFLNFRGIEADKLQDRCRAICSTGLIPSTNA